MRTRWMTIAILGLTPLLAGLTLLRSADRDVARGNEHYRQGAYKEALVRYRAAETESGAAAVFFNRGAAHFQLAETSEGAERKKHFEDAARAFQRAASEGTPGLHVNARYNLGNTRFRQGRYAEAVEAYKTALRAEPGHERARHNLALALRARDRASELDAGQRSARAEPGRTQKEPEHEGASERERDAEPDAEPDAERGAVQKRGDPDTRAEARPEGKTRPRDRAPPEPISLEEAERKLDELERRSRKLWLERLRRRAEADPREEVPR